MVSSGMMGGDGSVRVRSRRRERFDSGAERVKSAELPHSIEAEEMLLSCCLLDGADVLVRCTEARVGAASFYEQKHGLIFAKLLDMHGRQLPIDISTVAEELKAAGQLDQVGGYAFLAQVSSRIPTTAQASYFIEKVRELALRRAKLRLANAIAADCVSGDAEALQGHMSELGELEAYGHSALPPVMTWSQLRERQTPTPPELVAGVLHKGRRMILAGGSKSFKSWVLLDMAVAIATGTPWWGMATTQGKVLYVNFELPEWGLRERLADIARARQGLTKEQEPATSEAVEVWDLDGYGADIDVLLPHFEARLRRGQYALVILDPIYVCLGERDENSNGDVTQLMNRLAWLARRTGAAVAFGHHFSKGNQAEKEAKDRASGAGAWIRAPDTVAMLTAHEEEHCFVASFVLRSQKPKKEFVVRWRHPCMEVAKGLDPAALKTAGRPKKSTDEDVAKLVGESDQLTYAELKDRAEEAGIKLSTFKRRLHEARESGALVQVGSIYRRGQVDHS